MNVGGPAKLIHSLDSDLINSQIDHILVTGYCEPNEIDFLDSHELKGRLIRLPRIKKSINLFNDFLSVYKLSKLIKEIRPDILHTHTAKAGFIGRVAKIMSKQNYIKTVHTFHGHLLSGYFGAFSTSIVKSIEKFLAMRTDVLIAVSFKVKNDLIRNGIGKRNNWIVIYPGIKLPKINSKLKSNSLINLLWLGRFSKIKNPLFAVKSYEMIAANSEIKLTMVGGGELLDECIKYSKKKNLQIKFTGWRADIGTFLRKANLLLLTSINEGMPLVVLEAGAYFVPTLSTKIGGIEEFIDDNKNGFISENDLEIYSARLKKICEQTPKIMNAGLISRKLVYNTFHYKSFNKKHILLYKRLVLD